MKAITYMLIDRNELESSSGDYYVAVDRLTNAVLKEAECCGISEICNSLSAYIARSKIEPLRSNAEYLLELLMIGVLWNVYIQNARWFPEPLIYIFRILYRIRSNNPRLKTFIDRIRGTLTVLLRKKNTSGGAIQSIQEYSKLINWLGATGEFNEEVKRLRNWELFFALESPKRSMSYLSKILEFGCWFKNESKAILGKYTKNVDGFLNGDYRQYRFREDAMFCGRREVEYHLNMVGANIMNRVFYQKFSVTKQKVVLLPICMSKNANSGCQAYREGYDVICTGCTDDCNINHIRKLGMINNFSVRIVPHSSSFTNWLKQWKNQNDTGLVAVACILNLVTGGYQMKNLNIPAQCVFLDYCGCRKHWSRQGFATRIDVNRLIEILGKK